MKKTKDSILDNIVLKIGITALIMCMILIMFVFVLLILGMIGG